MQTQHKRADGRTVDQMRDVHITYNIFEFASGSVLFEVGKTKILCAVTLQAGVPPFLKGKKVGWLTAEYAMLPASTTVRSVRESEAGRKNGRCVEISRLIGRSLRTVVDVSKIGERTIIVDCDVLQADGSTRTACITAASLALQVAQENWLASGIITSAIMRDGVVALSVGLRNGAYLVDLNFEEDSAIDADFNIVLTHSGKFIEIQGSAERSSYTFEQLVEVQKAALKAGQELVSMCTTTHSQPDTLSTEQEPSLNNIVNTSMSSSEKVPFFSLKNRQNSSC